MAGTGEKATTPEVRALVDTPLDGPRAIDFDPRGQMYLASAKEMPSSASTCAGRSSCTLAGTGNKGYSGDGRPATKPSSQGPKESPSVRGVTFILPTPRTMRSASFALRPASSKRSSATARQATGPRIFAARCRLQRPHGVFVDAKGNVYIGDSSNHRVRKLVVE